MASPVWDETARLPDVSLINYFVRGRIHVMCKAGIRTIATSLFSLELLLIVRRVTTRTPQPKQQSLQLSYHNCASVFYQKRNQFFVSNLIPIRGREFYESMWETPFLKFQLPRLQSFIKYLQVKINERQFDLAGIQGADAGPTYMSWKQLTELLRKGNFKY